MVRKNSMRKFLRAPNKKTTVAQGSGFRAAGVRPEPTAQNPEPERPEVMLIGALSLLLFVHIWSAGGSFAAAAPKHLNVVATLSTFADLAKTVGGDFVDVSSVASPKFNPHFIEPKPSDVMEVKRAALLIHAGLDLELWRGPLLDAAGNIAVFPGQPGELDLSQNIELLEVPTRSISRSEGDIHIYGNPHYWVDPDNAKPMAQAIARKLSEIDPAHAEAYQQQLNAFLSRLDHKLQEWRSRLKPYAGQEIVGYHNEWPYLMRFAGLRMEQFLEPKPGIPPTPKQIEFIEQYVNAHQIRGIVQSTFFPTQAAEVIGKRTGSKVMLLCQSVGEVAHASDYLAMIDYNVDQLVKGLQR